jgi:hypothetical protein
MSEWRKMESAPRDGHEMLVRTVSRPPFGDLRRGYDIASWNGHSFSSRSGDICTHWMPLKPPKDE